MASEDAASEKLLTTNSRFEEAVRTLNIGKDEERSKAESKEALATFAPVLQSMSPEVQEAVGKVAFHAPRQYPLEMYLLEATALLQTLQMYMRRSCHAHCAMQSRARKRRSGRKHVATRKGS
jgi:hypothetical protein